MVDKKLVATTVSSRETGSGKLKKRDKVLQMYLQSSAKNYRKVRDGQYDEDKYTHIDQENADSSQNETIP